MNDSEIWKAREKAMKENLKARLQISIPFAFLPLLLVGLLMVFLPLYLTTHEIKWIMYGGLYTCVVIILGYLLYKYQTRDL